MKTDKELIEEWLAAGNKITKLKMVEYTPVVQGAWYRGDWGKSKPGAGKFS